MQLVLGVAVADSVARLALVDASNPASVLDRFEVRLADGTTRSLVRTIVDTEHSLAADQHYLSAINVCSADKAEANTLRNSLAGEGVNNVTVVSAADAATAFVRTTAGSAGEQTSALLLVDAETAALSVVGADDAHTSLIDAEQLASSGSESACTAMLERLREETGGAQTLYVLSTSEDSAALTDRLSPESPIPVHLAEEPAYVLARGAASASAMPTTSIPAAHPSQYATSAGPVIGEHLAYSLAEDSGSIPIAEYEDSGPLQAPMPPLSNVPSPASYADDPREMDVPVAAGRPECCCWAAPSRPLWWWDSPRSRSGWRSTSSRW